MHLFKKLDRSGLPEPIKREIKADAEWKDAAIQDFADSLAEAAAIEMNKAQIPSQHQHWINLGVTAGELALAHFALCDRIDKLILATRLEVKQQQQTQQQKTT